WHWVLQAGDPQLRKGDQTGRPRPGLTSARKLPCGPGQLAIALRLPSPGKAREGGVPSGWYASNYSAPYVACMFFMITSEGFLSSSEGLNCTSSVPGSLRIPACPGAR